MSAGVWWTLVVVSVVTAASASDKLPGTEGATGRVDDSLAPRSFVTDKRFQWPSTTRDGELVVEVPYEFAPDFEQEVEDLVNFWIAEIADHSCVRWVRRTSERDYVLFTPMEANGVEMVEGCNSQLGRLGGEQYTRLSSRCISLNTSAAVPDAVVHEMFHAMGFIHEQQRVDRDCFIKMNVSNPAVTAPDNLIYTVSPTDDSFPYDPLSIMHYRGRNRFESRFGDQLGQTGDKTPTELDWAKLNYMYCGAKHICQVDPAMCDRFNKIKEECKTDQTNDDK